MSGGHFDYNQHKLNYIIDELEILILNNNKKDEWEYSHDFPDEVLEKFKEAKEKLKVCYDMVHEIDWLVSSDIGVETFLKRWKEIEKANEKT